MDKKTINNINILEHNEMHTSIKNYKIILVILPEVVSCLLEYNKKYLKINNTYIFIVILNFCFDFILKLILYLYYYYSPEELKLFGR